MSSKPVWSHFILRANSHYVTFVSINSWLLQINNKVITKFL